MDLFRRFITRIGSGLSAFFGVSPEFGDSKVTPRRAIEYAPVWYAVNKIAGHFSQLPINCHRRLERGSTVERSHPGHKLVHTRPNEYQTAPEWKMFGAPSLLLYGNWRCLIVREGSRPVGLYPLLPDRSGSEWYEGKRYHGTVLCKHEPLAKLLGVTEDSQTVWFPDEDVFFVHGLSFNGLAGLNASAVMSNSLDAGLSAEDQVRNLAKKGFSGSLILEAPGGMFRNEEEAKKFLSMFREAHDGAENTGKTAMLREGIKANMVSMSGKDSQWIEQRLFQRQEAAMWFCLEEILGDDSSVSYNSLAEKHLAYLTNCLNRWLVHIEAACNRSLLTERQLTSETHYFKFNTNALMRMDPLKQAEYLTKLIAATVMSPNEAREKLEMNPYEGGDEYKNPAITVTEPVDEPEDVPDNPEPDDDSEPDARQKMAIVSRLRPLLAIEQQRVAAAMKTKSPVAAVERFYAKWQDTLSDVCEQLGGTPYAAAEHCRQSQDALIEMMGRTAVKALPDAVGELTAAWGERVEELADNILGATV
jgi:HK97 family phage portal protein